MKTGKIIEPSQGNIWEHERRTAKAIANTGVIVEFVLESHTDFSKSPDLLFEGILWEIKSPVSGKLAQIEKNLKRASRQSGNIIIDSYRIKYLPDKKIQQFLIDRFRAQKSIKRLLFINRKREVIDIGRQA
jgi:hypothetical protein